MRRPQYGFRPMEAATAPRTQWTFAQWGIVVLATLQLALGDRRPDRRAELRLRRRSARRERVLGVDFNGVHALSGFLLFLPAYYFALKPRWAVLYAIYVAVALIVTGIWAIFATSPPASSPSPTTTPTPYFHLATGALFAAVAVVQLALDRG